MSSSSTPRPLPGGLTLRLSVMMFLQYAIWGAWLPILYPFLLGHRQFELGQVGQVLAAGALGAIIGPFIAGQIADRWFSTERFLAVSHLAGAYLVWRLADTTDFATFLALSAFYGVIYAPTLALTNALAFHHIPDRDRDFGRIRLWGTIGWIVVGIAVGQWLLLKHTPANVASELVQAAQDAGRADAFRLSAYLGIFMGIYCLTLPHTPPDREAKTNASLAALGSIRKQPLLALFLIAVPISCIHQFYFVFAADFLSAYGRDAAGAINKIFGVGGGGLMTIGQMSEIPVLAAIPLLARRVSRKGLLMTGILAYAARMALFAYTDSLPTVLLGVALHGLCFGCFVFVAFMVVDEETTADVRASAQNLFNLVIVGIGIGVGSWVSTQVGAWATVGGQMDFTKLFGAAMWAALVCLALLAVIYPGQPRKA